MVPRLEHAVKQNWEVVTPPPGPLPEAERRRQRSTPPPGPLPAAERGKSIPLPSPLRGVGRGDGLLGKRGLELLLLLVREVAGEDFKLRCGLEGFDHPIGRHL